MCKGISTITRVHVLSNVIAANRTTGARNPTVRIVWRDGSSTLCDRAEIRGASSVVYHPDAPIDGPNGPVSTWIETEGDVIPHYECPF